MNYKKVTWPRGWKFGETQERRQLHKLGVVWAYPHKEGNVAFIPEDQLNALLIYLMDHNHLPYEVA